ncbi:MAG: hypothetical protein AB1696_19965 [Planctomycetota bacterium]
MHRRDFVKAGITALAAGFLPAAAFAARKARVTWAPYQCLDLNPEDMVKEEDIARIIRFATEFIPQSNTGKPPYDPKDPRKPGTERPMEGYGKRIKASEMSISVPNTYSKAVMIKKGLARLLAADKDRAVQPMLSVGLQFHTVAFDHPTDGVIVPPGFDWDWVMTVPHEAADARRRAWVEAGYEWSATPSVQLIAEKAKGRGWPTGWLRAHAATKKAEQYSIMPDLRIRECRKYFLDRYAAINKELGLACVDLSGKSGWLHGNAAPRNQPDAPERADPWLPSPYPGDSYRDANVSLVKEAVARFGAEKVTWTNTGAPTPDMMKAQRLTDYVALRDGGIRAIYDEWYGSWATNWTLAALVEKGALNGED